MSCNAIIAEMNLMNQLAEQKSADGSGQVAKNTAAAITGVFLIIPLFFIDPNNHNSVEEQAARNRAVKLQMIGKDKGCFDEKPNSTDENSLVLCLRINETALSHCSGDQGESVLSFGVIMTISVYLWMAGVASPF